MNILCELASFQVLLRHKFSVRSVSICSSVHRKTNIHKGDNRNIHFSTKHGHLPIFLMDNLSLCSVSSPKNYHNILNHSVNVCNYNKSWKTRCLYSTINSSISVKQDDHQLKNFECTDPGTLEILSYDFIVKEDFISEEEEQSMLSEIEPYLNRMKYEYDHWDDAIHGFRETERNKWTQKNKAIIQRVRDAAFPPSVPQLQYVHLLDLEKSGYIKPHVDSVKFCGNTISGISLLSSGVMRLVDTENKDKFANALIKRRSLYIMRDKARYNYTHEVLREKESVFRGEVIPRDRRISVICRNEP